MSLPSIKRRQLELEQLEDRCVPSIVVANYSPFFIEGAGWTRALPGKHVQVATNNNGGISELTPFDPIELSGPSSGEMDLLDEDYPNYVFEPPPEDMSLGDE
jgi:hypothetical protein